MSVKHITIIGTDSTHCNAFAKVLSQSAALGWQIKTAIRDTRSTMKLSTSRMSKIEKAMTEELNIAIYDELTEEIVEKTDAFMIASVDATLHLSQFIQVLPYKKPVFIDKPIAYSLEDTAEILRLAKENDVPILSCSSLRFSESLLRCVEKFEGSEEALKRIYLKGPMPIEKEIPGLFWYGIHTIESLQRIVGKTFEVLSVDKKEEGQELWIELHSGQLRCTIVGDLTGQADFSGTIESAAEQCSYAIENDRKPLYEYLLDEIVAFFETKKEPFPNQATYSIIELVEKINAKL